ncbi:MAG: hypothetical protein ACOC95_02030 [Planctomycetota bacterium]
MPKPTTPAAADLFDLAQSKRDTLAVSTLVMAQSIDEHLGTDAKIDRAIAWCKATGVTRIFLETFRNGFTADARLLRHARSRFEQAGIAVSGCVTPTQIGPLSQDRSQRDCYADAATRKRLAEIFESTAGLFDEIMIDDFLFTDCQCDTCRAGKGERTWAAYRTDLMVDAGRNCILEPARQVNPKVRLIIKYPNWFDDLQNRGYDAVRQTALFDLIWVGTETREPDDARWGSVQQVRGFFIMRWLGAIGGAKTGGGWFDEIDTGPAAYVEQARQTVLGGAREMMLFNYATLNRPKRDEHIRRLRAELPTLLAIAEGIAGREARGILAVKPPNSPPGEEYAVYEFLGMLGLPIVPVERIPDRTDAVFLPVQAAHEADAAAKVARLIDAGTTVLVTDGLVGALDGQIDVDAPNVHVLPVAGKPAALLDLDDAEVTELRRTMLAPLGLSLEAPKHVALYLIGDEWVAIESFADAAADVILTLNDLTDATLEHALPPNIKPRVVRDGDTLRLALPSRALALLRIRRSR